MKTSRLLLNILPLLLVGGAMVYAAAPGGGYLPGGTIDPDCAPGDTDCFVQTLSGADNLGNHTATQNINLNNFQLVGSGGTQGIFVGSTWNVGIWTTTPNNKLHVFGSSTQLARIESTALRSVLLFRDSGTSLNMAVGIGSEWNELFLTSNNNERIRIDASGNVGIWTSTPSKLLDISNPGVGSTNAWFTSAQGTNIFSFDRSNGTTTAKTQLTGITIVSQLQSRWYDELWVMRTLTNIQWANEGTVTSTSAPGSLRFLTSNIGTVTPTEKMRITSEGDVSIGGIIPTAKFDVAGNIKVANSNATCAAGNAWEIRYDTTTNKHQGCNGTIWNDLY